MISPKEKLAAIRLLADWTAQQGREAALNRAAATWPAATRVALKSVAERSRQIARLRQDRKRARERNIPYPIIQRQIVWRGVPVLVTANTSARLVRYRAGDQTNSHRSRRAAVRAWLYARQRRVAHGWVLRRAAVAGDAMLRKPANGWELVASHSNSQKPWAVWPRRPTRDELAQEIRRYRAAQPSRTAPDTLGWRAWICGEDGRLASPHQETAWETPELIAEDWDTSAAVRGTCGIHARRVPRNWRRAGWPDMGAQEGRIGTHEIVVTGLVERHGCYVLGTTGWRAQWVIIRALQAPTIAVQDALQRQYPEVPVYLSPDAAAILAGQQSEACNENR